MRAEPVGELLDGGDTRVSALGDDVGGAELARQPLSARSATSAVVVQADDFLGLSTALVAPTSTRARAATFRPAIELSGTETRVLVEQTIVVDRQRLGKSAGRLDAAELRSVDDALRLILAL